MVERYHWILMLPPGSFVASVIVSLLKPVYGLCSVVFGWNQKPETINQKPLCNRNLFGTTVFSKARDGYRIFQAPQPLEGGPHHIMRIRRTDRFSHNVPDTHQLHYCANRPSGNHAFALGRGFQE